jgi:predicted enzyme related to lactoylglutathione lyase
MELAWIVVDDFKKAVKFYSEVVGLQLLEVNEECGWAELQGKSGARLGVAKRSDNTEIMPGQNAIVTFTVDNIETASAEMVKKGAVLVGEVREVPGHVRMQLIKDLDGNQLQLAQMLN